MADFMLKQPKPVVSAESAPVYTSLWTRVSWEAEGIRRWVRARYDFGVRKYKGHVLNTHDGRDPRADLAQELVDALYYAQKWMDESRSVTANNIRERVMVCIRDLEREE